MEDKQIKIVEKLLKEGYEAYYVGGCIRDFQLGLYPNDFDIATNATPVNLAHIFIKDREKVDFVNKSFLITLVNGVEVATYRSEVYDGFSGKPRVREANTIEDDLSRRDLTINAMALDKYGGLIDPFNGTEDIKNKVIRFVGNPEKRIKEDPCRILRALRFSALLGKGFTIEEESSKAINKLKKLVVKYVAIERIRLEIAKCLNYKNPSIFFTLLKDYGLLKYILPSLYKCVGVDGGKYHGETIFEHNMLCGDFLPQHHKALRLAGYLHDVGKPDAFNGKNFKDHEKIGEELIVSDLKRLKFSNDVVNYISKLVSFHMKSVTLMKPASIRKLMVDLDSHKITWKSFVSLKIADRYANTSKSNFSKKDIRKLIFIFRKPLEKKEVPFTVLDLKVNGDDIMTFIGIEEGVNLGKALKFAFNKVIENPSINEKYTLLNLIAKNKNDL